MTASDVIYGLPVAMDLTLPGWSVPQSVSDYEDTRISGRVLNNLNYIASSYGSIRITWISGRNPDKWTQAANLYRHSGTPGDGS